MAEKKQQQQDNRSIFMHKVHEYGHDVNYFLKDHGFKGIETYGVYQERYNHDGQEWSIETDKKQSNYHHEQAEKKEAEKKEAEKKEAEKKEAEKKERDKKK